MKENITEEELRNALYTLGLISMDKYYLHRKLSAKELDDLEDFLKAESFEDK